MHTDRTDPLKNCAEFVRLYWPQGDSLPKHEKLRQAIAASIIERYWPAGARLPTESEWVEAMPCSLGTVQRALRALVADGLIRRRRGSGTIVADLDRPVDEPWHMRFLSRDDDTPEYLRVYTRVLGRRVIERTGPWSPAIDQRGRQVVKIDRIMAIADEFEVYAVFYALADRFPELVEQPIASLNGTNLKSFIARRYHVPVNKVRQRMRFEAAPKWVVSKCRWPSGAPATILNVVAYSLNDEAMYYQDFYIPPTTQTLDLGTPTRTEA